MNVRSRLASLLLLLVALATVLTAGTVSASAAHRPETRVRAINTPTANAVGQHSSETPGHVGQLRPEQPGSASGSCVATEAAARDLADSMPRPPGVGDPRTVAILDTPSGNSYSGVSGSGVAPHPAVQEALDSVPAGAQSPFHGQCAEIQCLSGALNAGEDVAGGTISPVRVRGPNSPAHGTSIPPCSSCEVVLKGFGVSW